MDFECVFFIIFITVKQFLYSIISERIDIKDTVSPTPTCIHTHHNIRDAIFVKITKKRLRIIAGIIFKMDGCTFARPPILNHKRNMISKDTW